MFCRIIAVVVFLAIFVAVAARTSDGSGRETTYVVRAGDTLWSIAATHYSGDPRRTIWELQERNELADTLLEPGQRLVLP